MKVVRLSARQIKMRMRAECVLNEIESGQSAVQPDGIMNEWALMMIVGNDSDGN